MAWGTKGSDGPVSVKSGGNVLSFIGAEVVIHGNVSGNGDIHLDGTIEGDLACNSLILGPGGRIKGNVSAEKATLGGTVEGTINAATLVVQRTARITGDLAYDTVSIENGAKLDGRMSHRVTLDASLKLVSVNGE
ncbi:MAG: polymer-forming cytoskeletal protein [Sphingomonadaceae bacterium]